MPQMSPLYWCLLSLYPLMLIMLIYVMIYSNKIFKLGMISHSKITNLMIWKW